VILALVAFTSLGDAQSGGRAGWVSVVKRQHFSSLCSTLALSPEVSGPHAFSVWRRGGLGRADRPPRICGVFVESRRASPGRSSRSSVEGPLYAGEAPPGRARNKFSDIQSRRRSVLERARPGRMEGTTRGFAVRDTTRVRGRLGRDPEALASANRVATTSSRERSRGARSRLRVARVQRGRHRPGSDLGSTCGERTSPAPTTSILRLSSQPDEIRNGARVQGTSVVGSGGQVRRRRNKNGAIQLCG
jgi:hypothetical protein